MITMSMKVLLLTIGLLNYIPTFGQVPPYEQIAFDFYRDSILSSNSNKRKFTLWTELDSERPLFHYPACLNFKLSDGDSVNYNVSKLIRLTLGDDKRFKIKQEQKGRYPRVWSTVSFNKNNNQHIVTIIESYKNHGITYHIEMNNVADIINWCEGGWVE